MKVAKVILARMASTRLERKAMRNLAGIPLVAHAIKRSFSFPGISDDGSQAGIVLAIPDGGADDELVAVGEQFGAKVVRGDEEDVLSRLIKAAKEVGADVVYRVTADNPLVDLGVVTETWKGFIGGSWDYAAMDDTPLGTTAEIVRVEALERAWEIADGSANPGLKEHPTLAMYENSGQFRMLLIPSPEKWHHPEWRFTVDTEADFLLVKAIMTALGHDAALDEIIPYLEKHPRIAAINSGVIQKGWDRLKEKKDAISNL